jgi:Lipid A 3-O-deacylase (PagL)
MRTHYFLFLLSILLPAELGAQTQASAPFQIFGGWSYLSNSFNGVRGSRQPLVGWDAAVAFPAWHNLRFKIDVSGYDGTNLGAPQRAYFIMAGGQYEKRWGRERLFAQALVGDGGLNRNWGAGGIPGGIASFSTLLGGGVDTPFSGHFGIRFEGGFQHTTFALIQSVSNPVPYRIPGLPTYFGRFSAGLVWIPRLKPRSEAASKETTTARTAPESELAFEGLNSFGHYHVFAYTWWSYLHVGGVEYDRHSWGRFIGARMDYVAEILPIAILQQPSKTDVFGDPLSTAHTTVAGLGISPIGLRMMWRDGKRWKPYYTIKGGMIGFTQKALSYAASYQNFSLQQSVGIQFRLADRWDFRAGVADFHFSNGFMVPSNPGIDEMAYTGALVYHLKSRSK